MRQILFIVLTTLAGTAFGEQRTERHEANVEVLTVGQAVLTNLHSSHYSHKTEVDVATGSYNLDCSGLGRLILKQAAPKSLASLPIEKGFIRPRAISFYSAFTNATTPLHQNGWQQIMRMEDAEPGDFIAWRVDIIKKGENSGHVMIVWKKPLREADGSYRVEILDSTSMRHASDSRSEKQTGVGTGIIWFNVDENGSPVSCRWSDRETKPRKRKIAIGRAEL